MASGSRGQLADIAKAVAVGAPSTSLPTSSRFGHDRSSRRRVLFNEDHNEVIDLEAGGRSHHAEYSDDGDEEEGSDDESSDDEEADHVMLSPTGDGSPVRESKSKSGQRSRSAAHGRRRATPVHLSTIHSTNDDGVEVVASLPSAASGRLAYTSTDATKMLTPDVAFVNGRRLPASIAEYAIAGDLSEEQLDQYEEDLLREERQEEAGDDNITQSQQAEFDLASLCIGHQRSGEQNLDRAVEILCHGDHHVGSENPENVIKEQTDEENGTDFVRAQAETLYTLETKCDSKHIVQSPVFALEINNREGHRRNKGQYIG